MKSDERTLSLVRDTQAFPDLPGTKDTMSADPPGKIKGDGSGKSASDIPGDDPSNYTGCLPALYAFKMKVKAWYLTDFIQLVVAAVIFANFIVVMFSVTQFVLDNKDVEDFCDVMDKIFIYFFLLELAINMFTSAQGVDEPTLITPWVWSWEFWVGDNWSWNWFDFVVIVTPIALEGASWASSIRILRLFRVIRVLKSIAKFEALQVVASSVSRSMSGVGATAIFILITLCMYSIIAVEMFGKNANGECDGDSCAGGSATWVINRGKDNEQTITKTMPDLDGAPYTAMTWQQRSSYMNENCDGVPLWKHFGNIRRSMLTMFVFTTVEGWPDIGWCLGKTYAGGSAFCTSFIIITALLMANIVVAIFTNKMEEAQEEVEKEQKLAAEKRARSVQKYLKSGALEGAQGVDLDGDGIADEYIIDADGDGIADAVVSKEEMAQATGQGKGIENLGGLENLIKQLAAKLDSVASKVDTLVSEKSKTKT